VNLATSHTFHYQTAQDLSFIEGESIHLVVTSPPYPMIEMWDSAFAALDDRVETALSRKDGRTAFQLMHGILDGIWTQTHRVLIPGGILCINIGDAARSVGGQFQLYNNHARILSGCLDAGFSSLPCIIWRKTTNAPNKFMGSGMLPGGAYVTLEHEHILILRKDGKREFHTPEERERRRRSAYFWEERNQWFNDQWQVHGVRQRITADGRRPARERSGAYPFAVPYRLICMHSIYEDTVLDPFSGVGTTSQAALTSGRSSVGVEIDHGLEDEIIWGMRSVRQYANHLVAERMRRHLGFVEDRLSADRPVKHVNGPHGFGVITAQERDLQLYSVEEVVQTGQRSFRATYQPAETHLYVQGDLF
jgi:DNA modification methylase